MLHEQPTGADAKHMIALTSKDISAARRLLGLLLGIERQAAGSLELDPPARPAGDSDRASRAARAREEFHNRRRREKLFGQSMFGEAAWDMLLALYILDVGGQRQTIGSLLHFSGTPLSTAKRWLDYLETQGLVRRTGHPTDRRTAFVSLTAKARVTLDLYYSGTAETGV